MDLLRGDRMLGNYTHIYHNLYKFVNISEIIRAHIFSMYDFDKIKPHIFDAAH